MAEVKVLVQGYADKKTGRASSSCVLIRENKLNIIVDPGMDKKKLLAGLAKENLKPSDINYVIISHSHIDHCGLAGIFANAKLVDDEAVYSFDGGFKEQDISKTILSDNIKIIKTPGHDPHHCSVLVKGCHPEEFYDEGSRNNEILLSRQTRDQNDKTSVIIAEDVIWWWDQEKQKTDYESIVKRYDPYEKNHNKLIESRKKVLKLADWIIPGHGTIFSTKNCKS